MKLSDEPARTLRAFIGDAKAEELGKLAFGLVRSHSFNTEELLYLTECFDYLAYLRSEGELDYAEKATRPEDTP